MKGRKRQKLFQVYFVRPLGNCYKHSFPKSGILTDEIKLGMTMHFFVLQILESVQNIINFDLTEKSINNERQKKTKIVPGLFCQTYRQLL